MNNFSYPAVSFQNQCLIPSRLNPLARRIGVNFSPSLTNVVFGTVVGQIGAAQSDVQTVTVTGTPTGGTFKLAGTEPFSQQPFTTAAIAYNATAAAVATAVQAALTAITPGGTVAGTGGALPSPAVALTFGGSLVNRPVPLMTVATPAFTGGSSPAATVAHTTVGATAGTFAPYSSAVVAAPVTAPTVAGNGSGSAFGAGSYLVSYTFLTANGPMSNLTAGETTPSPATTVTVTAAQNLRVTAITAPAGVTGANFYVDGDFAATAAVSGGNIPQTDITGATIAAGATPPRTNTAYTAPNGSGTQIAKGLLEWTISTDASGYVSLASSSIGGEWGQMRTTAPIFVTGPFRIGDVVGLDQTAIDQLNGAIEIGSLASGVGEFRF